MFAMIQLRSAVMMIIVTGITRGMSMKILRTYGVNNENFNCL